MADQGCDAVQLFHNTTATNYEKKRGRVQRPARRKGPFQSWSVDAFLCQGSFRRSPALQSPGWYPRPGDSQPSQPVGNAVSPLARAKSNPQEPKHSGQSNAGARPIKHRTKVVGGRRGPTREQGGTFEITLQSNPDQRPRVVPGLFFRSNP